MKRLIILSLYLLIVLSCSYGKNYPEKIVLNGDTLITITPKQLTLINVKLECKNVLLKEREVMKQKMRDTDSINSIRLNNYNCIIDNLSEQNFELNENLTILANENGKLKKDNERKSKKFWGTLFTSVAVGLFVGFMIGK